MGSIGGYYKGEKKKKKKDAQKGSALYSTPMFVPPQIISKKSKNEQYQ